MIKINKDLNDIPISLIPVFKGVVERIKNEKKINDIRTLKTTHTKRMEIINAEKYIDNPTYNSRYKCADIKVALNIIYKGKCAFCEQKEELTHVEHYRPKNIYYWLAYSWDNLLLSCPTCNQHKGINFDLDGIQVVFENTEDAIRNINSCSKKYDISEIPKMVNPEVTDPSNQLHFNKDGSLYSNNTRFQYTIKVCKVDRKPLNDRRRTILDKFEKYIRDALIENKSKYEIENAIKTNVKNFIIDSKNVEEEFLAFRLFAINNNWLNDIIKKVKQ